MDGRYYQKYACLSYQTHLSVCPVLCLCISFPFNSNLGGGNVKAYFVIDQQNIARSLDLIGILGCNILLPCGGINPYCISSVHGVQHVPAPVSAVV